jgi:hypothetical protein
MTDEDMDVDTVIACLRDLVRSEFHQREYLRRRGGWKEKHRYKDTKMYLSSKNIAALNFAIKVLENGKIQD